MVKRYIKRLGRVWREGTEAKYRARELKAELDRRRKEGIR